MAKLFIPEVEVGSLLARGGFEVTLTGQLVLVEDGPLATHEAAEQSRRES